jgi:VCBS repeat-containing protein
MPNHNPSFTGPAVTTSFSENSGTTGSSALHTVSGLLNFKDSDKTDTHTTSASLFSAAWSSGGTVPTASLNDLTNALTSTIVSDSSGSGQISWSFAAPDSDFDFLAQNERLVLTYDVTVTDNHGGTAVQTVTVTVTGSEDAPVVNVAVPVSITEQAGQTLSFTHDTAHVALSFTDPDLDNHHTAAVIGATAVGNTSGLLPGSLGTAELLSFYHVDDVVEPTSTTAGTIDTTFSAPDAAFDYLAAGETVTIDYTVQLNDNSGGVTTQDVAVTVTGTNDAPDFLTGPQSANFTENQAATLSAHRDLFFADVDLSDTHTVSTTVASAVRSSGAPNPLSDAQLLAAVSTTLEDSTHHVLGEVDWNLAIPNSEISFLGNGETLTVTYDVNVTDSAGATATQTVTVTILGTNDPPVITSGPQSAAISELADTTGSPAPDSTSAGTLNFTDGDTGDAHTASATLSSAVWSGGSTAPTDTVTAAQTALTTTMNDSTGTGSGSVDLNFSIPDNEVDFLAAGETLTLTYNVAVSDASESATQTVTVTVSGANDAPSITDGPGSGSVDELPNTVGSSGVDSTSGTLAFSDVDLSDTHSVQVALDSANWSAGGSIPTQTFVDLSTALATALTDSTGSGSGSVGWTFSIADGDLDFLSSGETLTATYDVTVNDGTATSTQTVTITMNGADDPFALAAVSADVADTPSTDTGSALAAGNVLASQIGDFSNAATITAVNGSSANVGGSVAGTYGSLFMDSSGNYFYEANSAVDSLRAGDTATDVFTFTGTDSHSQSVTTTLTFNITGADDNPVITAADSTGAMTEDAGPTALVNGGFETGDFTGWTADTHAAVEQDEIGGAFGHYTARLGPTGTLESLSQDVATTPGQHYTVSFTVLPDVDASSNLFTASWDGQTLVSNTDFFFGGFQTYTFDVTGDPFGGTSTFEFDYGTDGTGFLLDAVSVTPDTGPPTESASGTIQFSDVETGDTHTASVTSQPGYVGTFSLDPVSESAGTGSVDWHFTVDNSDIQFLSQGQTLTQVYQVEVADNHGGTTEQDVTITILGTNDAPTAAAQNIITDAGPNGVLFIPDWAMVANASDPDTADTLSVGATSNQSGGGASPFGSSVFFEDDATLGASFDYQVSDGHTLSAAASATVDNNPMSTTTLTGTSGDDILIGVHGGESLDGGGGNDVLLGNGGATLTGGGGNDIFGLEQPSDGPVSITDFNNTTQNDVIGIDSAFFGNGLTPGMDVSPFFESSADATFQSPFSLFHFDTANSTLYYSPDGGTTVDTLAQVQSGVTLGPADIRIV